MKPVKSLYARKKWTRNVLKKGDKMKWRIFSAAMLALVIVSMFATVALAADPIQPWMYAAIQPSGLGTVEAVQSAFFRYQNEQAFIKQYTTPAMWQAAYASDATNWLHKHGCSTCWISDDTLSFKIRIDAPVYMFDTGALRAE